tara:strand:+ start:2920 stop:3345 length:426 start_codon:yes stop_codon:yes gene_type:complete
MPLFINFLEKKYWINIVVLNKEIHKLLKNNLVFQKAIHVLKPYLLKLHATYLVRKKFIDRLNTDLEYRNRYFYIHMTEQPHFCWLKPPPRFLAINPDLENIVRILRREAVHLDKLLGNFHPRYYNFLLKHVILKDGKLYIR